MKTKETNRKQKMQTISSHYHMFVQKNAERKKKQPKQNGKCSMLRECQIIYNDVETDFDFNKNSDLEVFQILRNFSEDYSSVEFDFESEEETFNFPHLVPVIELDC